MDHVGEPRAQAGAGEERGFDRKVRTPLLLHIGYHKTASTWLQSNLFDARDQGFMTDPATPRHALVERLVRPDPLFYDPAAAAAAYRPASDLALAQGRTLVLSHERLSGYPSSGGRDRQLIAERLAATFPEARILIVIREQKAIIRSMYSQHVTDGGVESIEHFLATPEPRLCRKPSFCLEYYCYDHMLDLYRGLFGAERVLVLPYELLARDPAAFSARIVRHCGGAPVPIGEAKRVNAARPLLMQVVQRPLNMLLYHNELSPGALLHIPRFHKRYARLRPLFAALSPGFLERRLDARLRHVIGAHVGGFYAESNARTQDLIDVDLAALGYMVGGRR